MKFRNFLSGMLLGTALALLFTTQHYKDKIEEFRTEHVKTVVDLKIEQTKQLKEAWDYAMEECPELLTGFMALQDENLELKQALLNTTIKCELMIRDAVETRPGFATVEEMEAVINQLDSCLWEWKECERRE